MTSTKRHNKVPEASKPGLTWVGNHEVPFYPDGAASDKEREGEAGMTISSCPRFWHALVMRSLPTTPFNGRRLPSASLAKACVMAIALSSVPSLIPTAAAAPATRASGSGSKTASATPPSISTTSPLPSAVTGSAYSQTVSATGTTPITWSVTGGSLPAGLTLTSSTGVISGKATTAGAYSFTVAATNAAGSNSKAASLSVNTAPSISTTSPLPAAVTGSSYSQTLTATGTSPITWSVTSGKLPAGLTLASLTGAITGKPTTAGASSFTVEATNAAGSNSKAVSLTVSAAVVSVALTPASGTLTAAQNEQFTATVGGSSKTSVTWSLSPAVGSISTAGLYTAPSLIASSQTVTVKATSVADTTKSATATLTLTPVSISMTPAAVSLLPSQNQTFSTVVAGSSNTGVTWSISPAVGSLASSATTAVYVAPSSAPTTQSVTITATSVADPSKTATAIITIMQAVSVSLTPSTTSLAPAGSQQFAAAVSGSTNTAVTWTVSPATGTISAAGLYTAPSTIPGPQTVTVTAQSVADPTKSASAAINLSPPAGSFSYYVDSVNGSDSNPGTLAQPWQTIAKVNSANLTPGQSVAFARGGLWRETLTPGQAGTAANPITFGAYGTGALPQILGSVSASSASNWVATSAATIWYTTVSSTPNVVWRDGSALTLVSSTALLTSTSQYYFDSSTMQVYVYTSGSNPVAGGHVFEIPQRDNCIYGGYAVNYITINGLACSYSNLDGFAVSTNANYWIIANSSVSETYHSGIASANNSNTTISNNVISHTGFDATGVQTITYYGSGIALLSSANAIIDHNTVSQTGTSGILQYGHLSSNATIEYNEVYDVGTQGLHAYGLQIYGDSETVAMSGSLISYNYVHDCPHANVYILELVDSVTLYGNVLVNAFNSGGYQQDYLDNVVVTYSVTNFAMYNNTLYQPVANLGSNTSNLRVPQGAYINGATIENNVFYNGNTGAGGFTLMINSPQATAPTLDYNLHYISQSGNLFMINGQDDGWTGRPSGVETHGVNADPLFKNAASSDFSLPASSPAVGVALSLGAAYTSGLAAESTWTSNIETVGRAAWDIGAYVFSATGTASVAHPAVQ